MPILKKLYRDIAKTCIASFFLAPTARILDLIFLISGIWLSGTGIAIAKKTSFQVCLRLFLKSLNASLNTFAKNYSKQH